MTTLTELLNKQRLLQQRAPFPGEPGREQWLIEYAEHQDHIEAHMRGDARRKFHLRRVYLNSQGYTSTGQYYGIGEPLYEYEWSDTDGNYHYDVLRADNRKHAKERIRWRFRTDFNCDFYR
jgi:hypothetical protein